MLRRGREDIMNCIECLIRDGLHKAAEFVVNGQSVCQKHIHAVIRTRGQAPLLYTWSAPDQEPTLEPVTVVADERDIERIAAEFLALVERGAISHQQGDE